MDNAFKDKEISSLSPNEVGERGPIIKRGF